MQQQQQQQPPTYIPPYSSTPPIPQPNGNPAPSYDPPQTADFPPTASSSSASALVQRKTFCVVCASNNVNAKPLLFVEIDSNVDFTFASSMLAEPVNGRA